MAQNAYDALGTTPPSWASLRGVIVGQSGLTFTAASQVPNVTCGPALEIRVAGVTYFYDATDTTSAHDGVAVMVSEDGRRYKLGFPHFLPNRVETFGNTPPGSPALGNAYLIGAAPSGAWSSHANKIAVWTVNGWAFIAPANMAGRLLYVAAEDSTYQYTSSGWRKGIGNGSGSPGSIWPANLADGFGRHFTIENQTTNTPPGSPSEGVAYIVGPSPTGAWAGHQGKIAHYLGSAWQIYTPAEGWLAFDRTLNALFHFTGLIWQNTVGAAQNLRGIVSAYATSPIVKVVTGINNTSGAAFQYGYSDVTPPNSDQRRIIVPELSVTYAATAAGRRLRFSWDGFDPKPLFTDPAYGPTIAVFRNAEVVAIAWMRMPLITDGTTVFGVQMPRRIFAESADTTSHVYTLGFYTHANIGTSFTFFKNSSFSVEEIAA